MHIISVQSLKKFYGKYPDAKSSLLTWSKCTTLAKWQNLVEVRQSFNSADQVGNLIVFNIKGNDYRLITYIDFQKKKVFIRNFLTHAEYDTDKWKKDDWFT
ncbi:type II toxin-antitoxin system HigB family toxin [Aetokthonos hydrillicola Thurmond2011]|jgi:mRNA interferase HigB|uniref:Type II toxin-antitoxin system HigB family toxin n=1 Tax=Aetokthonos hydrillicola Thurmond2011 TaxID=2712845 RepID=A0AAP5MCW1_9CYAN|nr:type II toxin-antitoxin system HigB family toxin [Aetokthonos hydrillicola]MBO3457354.1 type II toxin-antitoxin system HigB family toxin [Aetokthonos hydrillicola CCALA 1050]MBW4583970.1 type II toxin-antitoxin system HigB family toxin [Aetokthonos hydrillicola CCALA 1050]MDR9898833.1 type II toxin-antitoxin system HigB family toxin [Aetokthonos hydrillicola Thurmond2011]